MRIQTKRRLTGCLLVGLVLLFGAGAVLVSQVIDGLMASALTPYRPSLDQLRANGTKVSPIEYGLTGEKLTLEGEGIPPQSAWWIPQRDRSAPVIVFLHGIAARSEHMLGPASHQHGRGYACLSVDLRGHGESAGAAFYGWKEKHDLKAWVDLLRQRGAAPSAVGFYGGSYGGAVALQAAAINPAVRAVVAFHPFSDFNEAVSDHLELIAGIRKVPLLDGWLRGKFFGKLGVESPDDISPLKVLEQCQVRPHILLVHGDQDRTLRVEHSRRLCGAFPDSAELIELPGAGHDDMGRFMTPSHHQRIDQFLDQHLKGKPSP